MNDSARRIRSRDPAHDEQRVIRAMMRAMRDQKKIVSLLSKALDAVSKRRRK